MKIDRHNYEEFFLLYVDNELSAEDRIAVEEFVSIHTDLKVELQLLQDTVFQPEPLVSFDLKSSLLKKDTSGINEINAEENFLLYADEELNPAMKVQVVQFLETHPQHRANFELIQQTKLQADASIVFPDKSTLYRKEKDDKVVPFVWWKMMAAAVVLLAIGIATWFLLLNNDTPKEIVKTTPEMITTPVEKEQTPDVVAKSVKESGQPPVSIQPSTPPNSGAIPLKSSASAVTPKKNVEVIRKKSGNESNIPQEQDVSRIDVIAKVDETIPVETPNTDPLIHLPAQTTPVASLVNTVTAESELYTEADQDNDILYVANTTVNKKNKLRGIFRKASRFIEKATHLDATNRGIRVANIEIGQK